MTTKKGPSQTAVFISDSSRRSDALFEAITEYFPQTKKITYEEVLDNVRHISKIIFVDLYNYDDLNLIRDWLISAEVQDSVNVAICYDPDTAVIETLQKYGFEIFVNIDTMSTGLSQLQGYFK